MKRLFFYLLFSASTILYSQNLKSDTALIIIDIQEFYFPGGDSELINPDQAAENAALLLKHFRDNNNTVIHVRHNYEPGGSIHKSVSPVKGEKVISKDEVNCFKDTELLDYINKNNIGTIVICGMQTHMCVEAGIRASYDFGFNTILIHDACATRDLKFNEELIPADKVHYSTLSTLKSYSYITDVKSFIKK